MKTYSEKLKDPRWQRLRLEIMERDGFSCRKCGSKENTLNVHHTHYRKRADPWDYEGEHLLTLCETCHQIVEARREILLKATADPSNQLIVMHFAEVLAGSFSPYSSLFGSVLEALHRAMLAEEGVKTAINLALGDSSMSGAVGGEMAEFDEALLDAQKWLFHIRQNLSEADSSLWAGRRHPVIEAAFPTAKQ